MMSVERMRQALTRCTRYRGMMVLVLWQAPVQPVVQPDGSIGFLFGGGTSELVNLSCEGDVIDAEAVSYGLAAVEADRNLTRRLRVDAVGGAMVSGTESHTTGFGAAVLRLDWQYFGIGAGGALLPIFEENGYLQPFPAAHLRVGSARGLHVRADIIPPVAAMSQQLARLAIGHNATERTQTSVLAGLAVMGSNEPVLGGFAEVSAPYRDNLQVRVGGQFAPGYAHPVSTLTVGVRYILPRR